MPPLVMVNVPPSRSLGSSLLLRGARAEVVDGLLDFGEAESIGGAEDGDDQALRAADGDADVVVVAVDDRLVADFGVECGLAFERVDDGFDEERHEAELDAVLRLEGVAVFGPQLLDCRHVDFVERREEGGLLLGADKPLGDAAADQAHRDDFFEFAVGCRRPVRVFLVRVDGSAILRRALWFFVRRHIA